MNANEIITMDNKEFIVSILDTLIWPLILIGFLIFYHKEVKAKFLGLVSAKFSADGAEVFFKEMQDELRNPQPKLKTAQPQGRGVSQKKPNPKPGLVDSDLPPYQQVFMINSKVEEYLKQMAVQNNISTDDFESLKMTDTLTQKGIIDLETRDKLIKITKLIRAVNPNITKKQIDIVRKYYENI